MEKDLEFPRFMCRMPGAEQLESGKFQTRIVGKAEDAKVLLAAGWHFDQYSAKAAYEAAQAESKGGKPTREELEQKATELGIEFRPQTSDKKLGDAIAAKLASVKP